VICGFGIWSDAVYGVMLVLSEGAMVFDNVVGTPQKFDLRITPEVLPGLLGSNVASPKSKRTS